MNENLNAGTVRRVVENVNMIVISSLLAEIVMVLMEAFTFPRIMFGSTLLQKVGKTIPR
jgi:hypothetical protein